jgi:hypothetical protein
VLDSARRNGDAGASSDHAHYYHLFCGSHRLLPLVSTPAQIPAGFPPGLRSLAR